MRPCAFVIDCVKNCAQRSAHWHWLAIKMLVRRLGLGLGRGQAPFPVLQQRLLANRLVAWLQQL